VCRARLEPGVDVAFTPDGRVHHLRCPRITCPVCSGDILPSEPIRRDADVLVHGNCWSRHERLRLGVTGPDRDRVEIIRVALDGGHQGVGGTSNGAVCGACTMRILAGSMEYEVEFARALLFRMHRDCSQLWQEEHRSVQPPEISGGSAASPSTSLMLRRRSRATRTETAAVRALSARLPLHVRPVTEE
jgi:hypothetical protein